MTEPITMTQFEEIAKASLEALRTKYGKEFIEADVRINDVSALKLFGPAEATVDVTLTPAMIRHLFFSNQQLHEGISALIKFAQAMTNQDAAAIAADGATSLGCLDSSRYHFRAFIAELLDRAEVR